ncbi:MAG: hypothetical protein IPM32_18190 [Ignavibacteriae bacterium]|nr:hypothetical protein [Ignavibacteriota bacterium]
MKFSSNDKELIEKLRVSNNLKIELETLLHNVNIRIENLVKFESKLEKDFEEKKFELIKTEKKILDFKNEVLSEIEKIILEKTKGFPWLSDAISQYFELQDLEISNFYLQKKWSAKKASEAISQISKQKSEIRKNFLVTRNLLKYYENLFPWLNDFVDQQIDDSLLDVFTIEDINDEADPVKYFVTKGEYEKLNETERNQLALDRYWKKKKNPWQIGRDYERYIGYLYESEGWNVIYQGIEKGVEDLGRDLICTRDEKTEVVQCKYWRNERVIHEKHINQLFGTTVEYFIKSAENRNLDIQIGLFPDLMKSKNISGSFYATCSFSDTSKKFANLLGIKLYENFMYQEYPSIKCNISRKDESKIYHLPFDQQYDKTVIEKNRGECYVHTVLEAEKLGFRRAWKWRGN